MFGACPQCGNNMSITSAQCHICHADIKCNIQMSFINSLSEGTIRTLLQLVAARGKLNGVANIMGTHRNNVSGFLAAARLEMLDKANRLNNDPLAALFVHWCKLIKEVETQPSQSSQES